MYEVPACPACYIPHVVCMTCKKDKPKMPCGEWEGDWWYCGPECMKTLHPQGGMCKAHRDALEQLRVSHPHLFRRDWPWSGVKGA